jgi:hypothetical protein
MRLIFDQVGLKGDPFGDEHPSQVSFTLLSVTNMLHLIDYD